jgi:hypothetical protein
MKRLKTTVQDILHLFVAPGSLFARLPQQHRSVLPCLILIGLEILVSLAIVSTGVHDHETDLIAELTAQQMPAPEQDDAAASEQKQASDLEKQKVFAKETTRLKLYAGRITLILLEIGLLSLPLFAIVALRGGKPNLSLIAEVLAWASFADLARRLFALFLLSQLQMTRVETSAAAFINSPNIGLASYILLRRLDPFVIWYWALVLIGLWKTRQLGVRDAIIAVVLLAVGCGLIQSGCDAWELGLWSFSI